MPVIIDHQLKEQIPYNPAIYPISFYQYELETLPQWNGPFHWHPGFEIATAETGVLDYQVDDKHIILKVQIYQELSELSATSSATAKKLENIFTLGL
jgi:hypothetical protein